MNAKYALNDISGIELQGGKITSIEEVCGNYSCDGYSGTGLPGMLIVNIDSSYGNESYVRHRIWLPDDWNGIFLGIGNGGYAGKLGSSMCIEASQGYAVAQTDMGTSELRAGRVVLAPDDMWQDYGWRATHGMAEVAKELILARYGRAPEYSYFRGSSAGGKQAFAEFQMFPEDFDGFIATVPSNNSLCLRMYFLWCFLKLRDGKAPLFNDEEKEDIYSLVLEFFEKHGKAKNGYITHGWLGEDTVERVIAYLKEKRPQLGDVKLKALYEMYDGPRNPRTGRRIFSGMPFGAEINSGYFGSENCDEKFEMPWFRVFYGEGFEDEDFDYDKGADEMVSRFYKINSANDPDIRKFKERGGKIICYSGGADPLGPWPDAMKYYNEVCRTLGGYDKVKDFFKYYVIPGRGHSDEGRGLTTVKADEEGGSLVDMLRAWREHGVEPDYLYGSHVESITDEAGNVIKSESTFSERIYPYKGDWIEGKDFQPCADVYYINGAKGDD